MDTHFLTERVATECRLGPAEVNFLLAGHRNHVEVTPTDQRGFYRLTPAGYVGTIVGPGCRFVIRPKIPMRNFYHLVDPLASVPVQADRTLPVSGTGVLDFLAGRLVRLLAERTAAGLHRAYAEREEQGAFLRGRLDLSSQVRESSGRKDRLHSRHDDYTADVPCNQMPKAIAELLLQTPLLHAEVRDALRRELTVFDAVSPIVLGPDSFPLPAGQSPEVYQPLLDLCRLLFEGLAPGPKAGPVRGPAFLLDMERVFERYVLTNLARYFRENAEYHVALQTLLTANRPAPGQPDLTMRPDFLLSKGDAPMLVLDTKWKRLKGTPLVTVDVYQVLAYCTALGVDRAVLVYPGRRDRAWRCRLKRSPVCVTIRTLRVVGSRHALAQSVRRLARSLRRG
jgi:5-methylcytosine-specific restriction enzyme subunit McrC